MATVLDFPALPPLRHVRKCAQLSLTQGASALGIAPSTLDAWERENSPQIDVEAAAVAYAKYKIDTASMRGAGKNMLFGCFPMRVARDILELEVGEIAAEFGYSPSFWTKIEANARCAPPDVIKELEQRVSARMSQLCGFA